jgi:hypothetical protein
MEKSLSASERGKRRYHTTVMNVKTKLHLNPAADGWTPRQLYVAITSLAVFAHSLVPALHHPPFSLITSLYSAMAQKLHLAYTQANTALYLTSSLIYASQFR